ncbi:MAG TPA: ribonuclease H-like domain-containing protein [Ignavibacteriaceae bacterium]|nr:ribonuclease H-like domain-containing protein [Ignavibacteriaceae bacterium]
MRKIVFDIETCSLPFESLTESQREYLLHFAEKEKDEVIRAEMINEAVRYTSLYPFTAKVISIGIYDIEKDKSFVYYESKVEEEWFSEDDQIHFKGVSEENMIKSFWRIAEVADQVITFNGRNFDVPFLMLRSALLQIKPSKNFLKNRFDISRHIDLLEQLTFFGVTRKFNLDFYCQSFGIDSPKSKDITGMEVKTLFEAGRIKEIAIYCSKDVSATFQLYKIWNEYLNF